LDPKDLEKLQKILEMKEERGEMSPKSRMVVWEAS
jgi:hypothetical protein